MAGYGPVPFVSISLRKEGLGLGTRASELTAYGSDPSCDYVHVFVFVCVWREREMNRVSFLFVGEMAN